MPTYQEFDDWISRAKDLNPDASEYQLQNYFISKYGTPSDDELNPAADQEPSGGFISRVGDTALDVAHGAVDAGQAVVGLAGMATGGAVSDGMRALGYDPERTHDFLSSLYSDARKAEEEELNQATGFFDAAGTVLSNPGQMAGMVARSAPMMLTSMSAARLFSARAGKTAFDVAIKNGATREVADELAKGAAAKAGTYAAAASEGLQQAGLSFDEYMDKGVELGRAYASSLGSGATTGLIGAAGGRIGTKLGLGDVEAGVAAKEGTGFFAGIAKGAAQEGLLEEMPQSATEQMWQNYAMERPLDEGVAKAAGIGAVVGAAAGGGFSLANRPATADIKKVDQPKDNLDVLKNKIIDDIAAGNSTAPGKELMPIPARPEMVVDAAGSAALVTAQQEAQLQKERDYHARTSVMQKIADAQRKRDLGITPDIERILSGSGIGRGTAFEDSEYDPAWDDEVRSLMELHAEAERFEPVAADHAFEMYDKRADLESALKDIIRRGYENEGQESEVPGDIGQSAGQPSQEPQAGTQAANQPEPAQAVSSQNVPRGTDQAAPAFVPTHETSDGTPVSALMGDNGKPVKNQWVDAQGGQIEDAYASPITTPAPAAQAASQPAQPATTKTSAQIASEDKDTVTLKGRTGEIIRALQNATIPMMPIPAMDAVRVNKKHMAKLEQLFDFSNRQADTQPAQPTATGQAHDRRQDGRPEVRRTNNSAREYYDSLSKEALLDIVLQHELTGIKGRRAFVIEHQQAAHFVSVDADSLKWINDNMSPDNGDKLLQTVGTALVNEFGYDNVYHISGDEFYVLGFDSQDNALLKQGMARVELALSKQVITSEKLDGTTIELKGLAATPGYGTSKQEADNELKSEKSAREKRGKRAGRGLPPASAVITAPEGQQDRGDNRLRVDTGAGSASGETQTRQATEVTPAKKKKPTFTRDVDTSREDLLSAIAKLGGLNSDEAEKQGIDKAEFSRLGYRILRVFTKKGKSFDHMAEALSELGYPVTDRDGNYTVNKLLDSLGNALAGNKVYSNQVNRDLVEPVRDYGQDEDIAQEMATEFENGDYSNYSDDVIANAMDYAGSRLLAEQVATPEEIDDALSGMSSTSGTEAVNLLEAFFNEEQTGVDDTGRQSSGNSEEAGFLETQTEEDLRERDQQEKQRQQEELAAEQKSKADDALNDFVLTGSNSEVDQAEARGQRNLFDAAPAEPTTPEAPELTESAKSDDQRIVKKISVDTFNSWKKQGMDRGTSAGWTIFFDHIYNEFKIGKKVVESNAAGGGYAHAEIIGGFDSIEEAKAAALNQNKNAKDEPADLPSAEAVTAPSEKAKPAKSNGAENFIAATDGEINFGEISDSIAKEIQRQKGFIRLQSGDSNYGLIHITQRHGDEIKQAGFDNVEDFVSAVAVDFDEVRKAAAGALLLVKKRARTGDVLIVRLKLGHDADGDFYSVETAYPMVQKRIDKKFELLWERRANLSADDTGVQSSFVSRPPDTGEATTANAQSQSNINTVAQDEVKNQESAITAILDAANVTGKDRLDIMAKFRSGEYTADDIRKAYSPNDAIQKDKAKQETITDFGQKIEGARKDVMAAYAERMAEAKKTNIADVPLSQSWPEPDYIKMIEEGVDSWVVAFIHAARDEIPTKPKRGWKVKRWSSQVQTLRDMAVGLIDGSITKDLLQSVLNKTEYARINLAVGGRADLYEIAGHTTSLKGVAITSGQYSVFNGQKYNPSKIIWSVERKGVANSNWPTMLAWGDTREAAIAGFKQKIESGELETTKQVNQARQANLIIWTKAFSDDIFLGVKSGGKYITIETFTSQEEARKALSERRDELLAKLEKMRDLPSERRETNQPRVGVDHRNGQDVTPQIFQETFGFRGGQFGETILKSQAEAQQKLNETYDALMDMAGILGLPPKALSLNGELGIAFGARGKGGKGAFSAHYEPGDTVRADNVVINLTRKRGAGALAHEWWHALDNYFTRLRGQKRTKDGGAYLTETAYKMGEGVRPEIVDAFAKITRTVYMTGLKQRSGKLDALRSKNYWTTGREMTARAFESYIIESLRDQSASNDYLANIVSQEYWDAKAPVDGSYPYPEAAEIPAISAAYREFFDTIETKETDKGVALFSRTTRNKGTPATDIRAAIAPMMRELDAGIPVEVVDDYSQLPEEVQAKMDAEGVDIEGVAYKGRVYLVASQISSVERAMVVLFDHELRHIGLRKMFGNNLSKMLRDAMLSKEGAKIRQFADERGIPTRKSDGTMDANGLLEAAEEYIVNLAETGQDTGLWQKVKAFIRQFLRDLGIALELNDTDLAAIVAKAGSRDVLAGTPGAITEMQEAFSRMAPTFYSQMQRVLADKLPGSGSSMQMKQAIEAYAKKGDFKQEELEWSGVTEWLDSRPMKKVTKQEVLDFLKANEIQVQEVVLGEEGAPEIVEARDLFDDEWDEGGFNDWLYESKREEAFIAWEDESHKIWGNIGKSKSDYEDNYKEFVNDVTDLDISDIYTDAQIDDAKDYAWREFSKDYEYKADEINKENAREADFEGSPKPTKFSEYQLTGGENYRELLLTLPGKEFRSSHFDEPNIIAHVRFNERTDAEGKKVLFLEEVQSDWHQNGRKDGYKKHKRLTDDEYFDRQKKAAEVIENRGVVELVGLETIRNALDYIGSNSDFANEIPNLSQSDINHLNNYHDAWVEQRFSENAVPDAPFKTTWPMLVMKRMIRYAAENGFDRIAWATGEQQSNRYDLSKQVDAIRWYANSDGTYNISYDKDDKNQTAKNNASESELEDLVGKDLAKKIIDEAQNKVEGKFTGLDLKVGGEGMKAFYDQILPKEVGKYVKKWGGKVGKTDIGDAYWEPGIDEYGEMIHDGETESEQIAELLVHSIDITDSMRSAVIQGQPMFSRQIDNDLIGDIDEIDIDGIMRHTKNSNGQPIHSTKAGVRNFWKWFGNSKAVDVLGRPLVVYHGSPDARFVQQDGTFKTIHAQHGMVGGKGAHWFAKDRYVASTYADDHRAYDYQNAEAGIVDAYLKLEAPLTVDGEGKTWREAQQRGKTSDVIEQAQNGDNDGVIIKNVRDNYSSYGENKREKTTTTYVVFESSQIKSATANTGDFSPDTGDIRYSRAAHDVNAIGDSFEEQAKFFANNAGKKIKGMFKDRRRFMLNWMTGRQIVETYGGLFGLGEANPIEKHGEFLQAMEAKRERAVHKAERDVIEPWEKLSKEEDAALADVMLDATYYEIHADQDKAYEPLYKPDWLEKKVEESKEEVARLQRVAASAPGDANNQQIAELNKAREQLAGFEKSIKFEAEREAAHTELMRKYAALSQEAKDVYAAAQKAYIDQHDQLESELVERIVRAIKNEDEAAKQSAAIKAMFTRAKSKGPYFPMSRFGDYVVMAQDADGNYVREHAETEFEQDRLAEMMRQEGYENIRRTKLTDANRMDMEAAPRIAHEMFRLLEANGIEDNALKDDIYQLVLKTMPGMSFAKHSIHRRKIAGYTADMKRAFSSSILHGSHHIARVAYSDQLANTLQQAKQLIDRHDKNDGEPTPINNQTANTARDVVNHLNERFDKVMNPTGSPFAAKLGNIGFIMYLGASPAAGLVNLTQTVLVTYPKLAAKYGWGKAGDALWQAAKDFAKSDFKATSMDSWLSLSRNPNLKEDEHALIEEMIANGTIDVTQSHWLAALSDTDTRYISEMSTARKKAMRYVSSLFHNAEVANREVSLLAAYRLAKAEGMAKPAAYAQKVAFDTHYDYSSSNRAQYMKNDFVKVMTMFKNYSQHTIYLLAHNAYNTYKIGKASGAKEAWASEYRKNLTGVLGMHALFAGAFGLPLASMIFAALDEAFGDDDEPYDSKAEFQQWANENFGEVVGTAMTNGVFNAVGMDMHGRVGLNQLVVRDQDKTLEGRDQATWMIEQAAGPMFGIMANAFQGAKDMGNGEVWRGFERMVPKFVRDFSQSARYAAENGVLTYKDEPIVEDLSLPELGMKAMGFNPSRIDEAYDNRNRLKNAETHYKERRRKLLNQYYLAVKNKDLRARARALEEINKYNEANKDRPFVRITRKQIQQSMKARMRASEQTKDGVYLDKRYEFLREEMAD